MVPVSLGLEVLVGAGVVHVVVAVVVDAVGDDFFLFSVFFGCFILPESLRMLV